MVTNNGLDSAILKAKFGTDIRKSELHHIQDLNFNDLILMMQRIFQIKVNTNILLKYRDTDGDWITLANDDDVMFALRHEPSLYVEVSTNIEQGSRPVSPLNSDSVLTTRVSGISVNDEVSALLLKSDAISTPVVKQQHSVPLTVNDLNQQQQPLQVSTPITQHQLSFNSIEKPPSVQSFANAQNQAAPPFLTDNQQQQQANQIPTYGAVELQTPSVPSSVGQAQHPPYGYEQNTQIPSLTAAPQHQNHQHLSETQQFQPYSGSQQHPPVLPPTSVGQPQSHPAYGTVFSPQQHYQQNATLVSAPPVHHEQQQLNPPYVNQHQQQQPMPTVGQQQQQVASPYGNNQHQTGLPPTSIGQPPQQVSSFSSPPQPFGYAPPPPVSSVIGGAGGPVGNPFSRAPNTAFARPPSNFGNYFQ